MSWLKPGEIIIADKIDLLSVLRISFKSILSVVIRNDTTIDSKSCRTVVNGTGNFAASCNPQTDNCMVHDRCYKSE